MKTFTVLVTFLVVFKVQDWLVLLYIAMMSALALCRLLLEEKEG